MKNKLTDCGATICNRTDIMTREGEFMSVDEIKGRCECKNKQLCITIAERLKEKKIQQAEEMILLLK